MVARELLDRSEEHTSELQSPQNLVCRLLHEKKIPHNCRHVRTRAHSRRTRASPRGTRLIAHPKTAQAGTLPPSPAESRSPPVFFSNNTGPPKTTSSPEPNPLPT